jgi:hypothetical protein
MMGVSSVPEVRRTGHQKVATILETADFSLHCKPEKRKDERFGPGKFAVIRLIFRVTNRRRARRSQF